MHCKLISKAKGSLPVECHQALISERKLAVGLKALPDHTSSSACAAQVAQHNSSGQGRAQNSKIGQGIGGTAAGESI